MTRQVSTARDLSQLDGGFDSFGGSASIPGLPFGIAGGYFQGTSGSKSFCDPTVLPGNQVVGGEAGIAVGEPDVSYYHVPTYTVHKTLYTGSINNPISWAVLAVGSFVGYEG